MSNIPLEQRRFDRLIEFDEKSRQFPLTVVAPETPVSRLWWTDAEPTWPLPPLPAPLPLDQGEEGACVGFGVTAELILKPIPVVATNDFAFSLYRRAQELDEFPNTPPEEGSSVLAGLKAAQEKGHVTEYRWSFGLDDLKLGLSKGPVVVGTWWRSEMNPRPTGAMSFGGTNMGGHCWVIAGQLLGFDWPGEGVDDWGIGLQSWGPDYGMGGLFGFRLRELQEQLLDDDGEAAIILTRQEVTQS